MLGFDYRTLNIEIGFLGCERAYVSFEIERKRIVGLWKFVHKIVGLQIQRGEEGLGEGEESKTAKKF